MGYLDKVFFPLRRQPFRLDCLRQFVALIVCLRRLTVEKKSQTPPLSRGREGGGAEKHRQSRKLSFRRAVYYCRMVVALGVGLPREKEELLFAVLCVTF